MQDSSELDGEINEPPQLRFLRGLVTVLTATMIVGIVVIIALIWIRFNAEPELLPNTLTLPDGEKATAVTRGDGWLAVVTKSQKILIFDSVTGQLKQSVVIKND